VTRIDSETNGRLGCRDARGRLRRGPEADCQQARRRELPDGAADALLAVEALECWFPAKRAQWRTLSHESHYDVLVVTVEAYDLRDAGNRVALRRQSTRTFSEIMIYARPHSRSGTTRIRRVRWTRGRGVRRSISTPRPSTSKSGLRFQNQC
jgi:hypothetical protein